MSHTRVKRFKSALAIGTLPAIVAFAGLGVGGAVVAGATSAVAAQAHSAMSVTLNGKFQKIDSMSSFTLIVGVKHYVVKLDAMTHVKVGAKNLALSSLKSGESMTVKGHRATGYFSATSVVVHMM